jgi:hypothetical protein
VDLNLSEWPADAHVLPLEVALAAFDLHVPMDDGKGRMDFAAPRFDHRQRRLSDGHGSRRWFDDSRFFPGDSGDRLPEVFRVLEIDAGHDGDDSVDHVRGVHPSTHADLDHGDVHRAVSEILEGHRRRDLEERRVIDRPGRGHRPNRRLHARPEPQHIFVRDRDAVHLDAFVEPDEVRRRVQADPVSCRLQGGGRIGAHRPLSVRPRHVQDLQVAVGIPQERKETTDVLQTELDPEPLEAVEVLQGRFVIH